MVRAPAVFLGLYVLVVVYLSLFPFEFLDRPRVPDFGLFTITGRRAYLDIALNTLFYLPLGVSAAMSLPVRRERWRWLAAVALGAALSYAIECAQMYSPRRYPSWSDLAANTAGTALGALAGVWLSGRRLSLPMRLTLSREGVLFLILWLLWQTFPMVPATSLLRFGVVWDKLTHPEWPLLAMLQVGLGFLSLAWVLGRGVWIAAAFAALIAQGFLLDRELSVGVLIAAAGAWLVASLVARPKPVAVAAILTAWLMFEEFRPFHTGASNVFAWAPFGSWFALGDLAYYPVLFGKLFLYTSVPLWLREARCGRAAAIAIPLAILAAGEWAQQYLPGRTPETTDLAVLAAGAVLLALAGRDRWDS